MLRPQLFELNRQCFLVILQSVIVFALLIVHRPDVVVGGGHMRMLRPQLFEINRQCFLEMLQCLVVLAGIMEGSSQFIVQFG